MSHELLLLAGEPTASAQESRRRTIAHAITAVPRAVESSQVETDTVVAALVVTSPDGGTVVSVDRESGGLRVTVAVGARGLRAAQDGIPCAAEAGHVTVLLTDDGDVVLSGDRVGFLPCYWSRTATTLAVSTHLASLVSLGVSATADEQGLVEYLAACSPLGTRTLLREATVLAAGGRLRWGPGRWVAPQVDHAFTPTDDPLASDEATAAFAEVWARVVSDAFSGGARTMLGLSGGLDSRGIAEGAVTNGIRPVTYTYGAPPSREPASAARVARALGLPSIRIPVTADRVLQGAVETLDLLDGAHSPAEMYERWFSDVLRGFADTVVNGHAGGPLWGEDKAFGLTDRDAVVDQRVRAHAGASALTSSFLSPDLAAAAPDLFRSGLSASLDGWDLRERPELVNFWHVQNWELRWGNMFVNALRRSGIRTEAPYLHSAFLGLASRFTTEQRRNGRLYLQVHRALFPRTAGIPRGDDGNAPRALNHVYWTGDTSYVRQLGALALSHPVSAARRAVLQAQHEAATVLRRRTGHAGLESWTARRRSVFPSDVWLRSNRLYADRLIELLECGDHPVFAQSAVDAAIADIRGGSPRISALVLGRVAAARAWLSDYEHRAAARRSALPA